MARSARTPDGGRDRRVRTELERLLDEAAERARRAAVERAKAARDQAAGRSGEPEDAEG